MAYTWPISRDCLPPLPTLSDPPTTDEQAAYDAALARRNAAEDLAVHVLWALSARQFGAYEVTVRPCVEPGMPWVSSLVVARAYENWSSFPCGCMGRCTVSGPRVVHLPGPVAPDTEDTPITVSIAGVTLEHDQYVLEGDALYRRNAVWPSQDLGRPLGESDTWSVTYTRGTPAPAIVGPLVGALAREFYLACDPDTPESECRIPSTLSQLTRQGVTHVFDPAKILAAGYTGLPEVDQWIASVNPNRLAEAPVVI